MPYERTGYAPWSLTREAGVQSATVDGTIQVPQYVQPTLSVGFVDERGNWKGTKSSDNDFTIGGTELAVPNGQDILVPGGNEPYIDMRGFKDLFIALKVTRGDNYAISAVMGTDTQPFANLTPVNPASVLRGASLPQNATADFQPLLEDGAQSMVADVWNILILQGVVASQRNLQFKIVNNTGGNSDMQFAYMRLI